MPTALRRLAHEAASCTRCPLYAQATQTVFGEGPRQARLFLIGETPGDHEDQEGHVFVGPAGRVLDEALEAAGIERRQVYLTNAVKHFKWEARGKRRLHQRPNRTEIVACHPWLEQELVAVDPAVVVAMGAVAGESLWGPSFRVGAAKGKRLSVDGRPAVATVHPSAVLRGPDPAVRAATRADLVDALRRARRLLAAAA